MSGSWGLDWNTTSTTSMLEFFNAHFFSGLPLADPVLFFAALAASEPYAYGVFPPTRDHTRNPWRPHPSQIRQTPREISQMADGPYYLPREAVLFKHGKVLWV